MSRQGSAPRTRRQRLAAIADGLGPYARRHRRQFLVALVASVLLTLAQLALPWPLKGIVELTLDEPSRSGWMTAVLPESGSPVVWLTAALVVIGALLGLAEHRQRLAVARFVVPAINDARLGIFARYVESSGTHPARDPGDVLTRVVGDSARLRVGLKGVLVHVLQHGLFVLGVSVVLLFLDLRLGLGYLVGLTAALGVALVGTDRTAALARRRRRMESRRATRSLRAAEDEGLEAVTKDPSRDRADALVTRTKGLTAWAVQGVLALTACLVLTLAVNLSESGSIDTGDVALVASYLLMLHYPMMRMGRQITRLGPQLTSAERLAGLAEPVTGGAVRP